MGFHLITSTYAEHVACMTKLMNYFKDGPVKIAGHLVGIYSPCYES